MDAGEGEPAVRDARPRGVRAAARRAVADRVDLGFWTEAARLSEHGIDAVVFGPGEVEQAHAADEFVTIADLETARATFATVLG